MELDAIMDHVLSSSHTPPFPTAQLDALMDEQGIDVLLVNSKHNVQYLLGGHRAAFFNFMDAIGVSRYLPIFVYPKGHPDKAAFIGHRLERYEQQLKPFWTPTAKTSAAGTLDAVNEAVDHLRHNGIAAQRLGVETGFLPMDAAGALRSALPDAELIDCSNCLDQLRAVKSAGEIERLRIASQRVLDSMQETIRRIAPGMTKREIVNILRTKEVKRGLTFEYCFLSAGSDLNRATSDQVVNEGDIVCIDSGGNYQGYIGDVARMCVVGAPDQELVDLLGEVEAVQQAAFSSIGAGVPGNDIYAVAEARLARSPIASQTHFLAHGMGLVSHEAPRLTSRGPIPYQGREAVEPLKAGMVISVETTLAHARRGLIKIEDSVAVTAGGFEFLGEGGRGWNIAGRQSN